MRKFKNSGFLKNKSFNIVSRFFLSSFIVISFFYVVPIIINFTDKNLNAITNSFVSILTTSPGSKILNPRFGVNLGNLLFLPVTSSRGQNIGEGVVEAIQRYENRIIIQKCEVIADPEQNQYIVNLTFKVPNFDNEVFTIKGRFKDSGFYIER